VAIAGQSASHTALFLPIGRSRNRANKGTQVFRSKVAGSRRRREASETWLAVYPFPAWALIPARPIKAVPVFILQLCSST